MLEEVPGIEIEVEGPIGETWELVDREEHVSVIRGGGFDGRSLRGLMMSAADAILGVTSPTESGHFPIMIKYLCATKPLKASVSVKRESTSAGTFSRLSQGASSTWV